MKVRATWGIEMQRECKQVAAALRMLLLTPHIEEYLRGTDPRALKQAQTALEQARRRWEGASETD
jgi:hypothetical protein